MIDKPQAKSQSVRGIWPLGCHVNLIDHPQLPPIHHPTHATTFKHEGGLLQENLKIESYSEWSPLLAQQKNPGGQQEEEHGVVHHVQEEHYHRKVLRVWVIVSGPVGIPKSSWVNKRSPKTINLSPNYKFLGLFLSTTSHLFLWNWFGPLIFKM